MSNLSVNTITDASGGSTASVNGYTPQASNMQPFNRIINGAMTVDQRNAGASYTQVNGLYSLDRWAGNSYDGGPAVGKFSVQQSATAPDGFATSLLVTSLAATADGGNDIFDIEQKIEGFNSADLAFGTASAKTITLSFWVRSSLTGTFGGAVKNNARDRAYPFAYTISSANTFEYKTITIAGDTSGTWVGATSGTGLWLSFGLGVSSNRSNTAGAWAGGDLFSSTGATSVVGTSGATFYITGVQLEAGSFASSFAHEDYGTTLQKCQRYYQRFESANGVSISALYTQFNIPFPVEMRATPTGSIYDANGLACARITDHYAADSTVTSGATISIANSSKNGARVQIGAFSGLVTGRFVGFLPNNSYTSFIRFDAEL